MEDTIGLLQGVAALSKEVGQFSWIKMEDGQVVFVLWPNDEPKRLRTARGPDKAPRRKRGKITVPTDGEEQTAPFVPTGSK